MPFPFPLSCDLALSPDGGVVGAVGLQLFGESDRSHSDASWCLISSSFKAFFSPLSIPSFPARPNDWFEKRVPAQLPRNGYSDEAVVMPNVSASIVLSGPRSFMIFRQYLFRLLRQSVNPSLTYGKWKRWLFVLIFIRARVRGHLTDLYNRLFGKNDLHNFLVGKFSQACLRYDEVDQFRQT